MTFEVGERYSRARITEELGLDHAGGDPHAVLVNRGRPIAVVVTQVGINLFNRKKYVNELLPDTFKMHGENDDRGGLLEDPSVEIGLFFKHADADRYRCEGRIRFREKMDWVGEPERSFVRLDVPIEP